MSEAIIQALRRKYMENIGNPAAQLIGGGVRGYLGLDAPEYADGLGMEAYRNAAALSNTPVVGMPSMAVRAGTKAAPAVVEALRRHGKGFQEYNRALGPAGASQAIVWHGSPHKFDKFDASKIGTGEGAQAYGHGLYLAESPGVAGSYKKADQPVLTGGKQLNELDPSHVAAAGMHMHGGNAKAAIGDLQWSLDNPHLFPDEMKQVYKQAIDLLKRGEKLPSVEGHTGNLYKVDLPDEKIARMLDWDKPLSKQAPKVRAALEKIGYKYDPKAASAHDDALLGALLGDSRASIPKMPPNPMGSEIARGKGIFDQPQDKVIAEKLRRAGIPGIRYLDEGSRAKGQGTSNFVVFPGEEEALTILERNNEIINALRRR